MPTQDGGNTDAEQRRMNVRRQQELARQLKAAKAVQDAAKIASLARRLGR